MKNTIFSISFLMISFIGFAQVGIGTNTPDASAVLDISSTTKALLLPRVTRTQMEAIVSPAESLIVYCTTCSPKGMYIYNGTYFKSTLTQLPSHVVLFDNDVYNPVTQKVWMDRNLGASQVATASNDILAYGDLYQWGRNTDGHEDRSSSTAAGPVTSGNEGANFITTSAHPNDWLTPQDDTRWNLGTEESPVKNTLYDPCPTGYRVPTETELASEIDSWSTKDPAGAFGSPLKFTLTGWRDFEGTLLDDGINNTGGLYYSSSIHTNGTSVTGAYIFPTDAGITIL